MFTRNIIINFLSKNIIIKKNHKKNMKKPKLDFGPTKKDHGWFYYVWNWKTYVFYALLIVGSILAFIDQGITGALSVIGILYGLKLLGKFL